MSAPRRRWVWSVALLAVLAGCKRGALGPTGTRLPGDRNDAGSGNGNDSGNDAGAPPTTDDRPCTPIAPTPQRIWRLSVRQISSSVRDLLGIANAPDLGTQGGESPSDFFSSDTLGVDGVLLAGLDGALDG